MFDPVLAFEKYRLEVVKGWPASDTRDKLLAAIEFSLRKNDEQRKEPQKAELLGDSGTKPGDETRPVS